MASVKVIFRASSVDEHEGTLYYRIIHKRLVRQIHTGIRIARDEWDDDKGRIKVWGTALRLEYLNAVQRKLMENLRRLESIVARFERLGQPYTAGDVSERYFSPDTVAGFISFARKLISESRRLGQTSAAEHYSSALNSFIRYRGEEEIPFDDFDSRLIMGYESYLKGLGLCPNTTSYYMRKLRAIYNNGVEQEFTPQRNPFRHVYTGVAKTTKRAVSIDIIRALRDMDLTHEPLSELARDIFLFSFYTRGMSVVDMSYLKKSDIRNGILVYRRKKTNQQLSIRWEHQMQDIVSRHGLSDSEFLLPLIKHGGKDHRRQYLSASHMINRRLKKLGERLGLPDPLTLYRARHSWASIARNNDVPLSVISEGMGHDSEKTTRIYLASLDTSKVDKANNTIINLLDKYPASKANRPLPRAKYKKTKLT